MTESGRALRISVLRHNPNDPDSEPHIQTFNVTETAGMTLFIALTDIRENQDPTLQFDFVCRAGICGSCGMLINGKPGLACRTQTKDFDDEIMLAPLPVFRLIGDLSVDTGAWMQRMSDRLDAWLHTGLTANVNALEERMEPALAQEIYELDRCIECGCCIAACATAQMRDDFVGAVGLNRIARFRVDPRDQRSDADMYELIGDDDGVFGCMTLLGCEDYCPKQLSLGTQIAWLRRRMVIASSRG